MVQTLQTLNDAGLLADFCAGSEDAFTELVRRHRPLVVGVCERILGNAADCDDAVQAVFLTLARKAEVIDAGESLDGWLRQTALYVAQRARNSNRLRRARECETPPAETAELRYPCDEWQEIKPMLEVELRALPAKYRAPLVLHYLKGLSQSEVARTLGCSYGTISGRLSRARELLRDRLASRGIAIPIAILATLAPQLAASESAAPSHSRDENSWRGSISTPTPAGECSTGIFSIFGIYIYPQLCAFMILLCVFALVRAY